MHAPTQSYSPPAALYLTEDPEACQLIAEDAVAFVIGFILDQQVKVQLAFNGPLELKRRLGHLDPHRIAGMDVEDLVEAVRTPRALHRYSVAMAQRIHACMEFLVERYDGDAEQVWLGASDREDVIRRLRELPGFGEFKAWAVTAVLARQFGMDFPGWEAGAPPYGALAYVDSLDDLAAYQQRKREYKLAMRKKG